MTDGYSSIEQVNHPAVLSLVNGHSSITLFLLAICHSLHLGCIISVRWTTLYHPVNLLWVDLLAMMRPV